MRMRCLLLVLRLSLYSSAEETVKKALIRDITSIEGVRENSLLGYGIVVGLRGTGDKQQTLFTTQTLANMLQRMGVQVPSGTIKVNNVAGVFVTAALPAFASPGTRLDVTVSSTGDAKSLDGGLLLLTPLYGPDGKIYGSAQGALTLDSAGITGNTKQLNHPTVGRIPAGAVVERDTSLDLNKLDKISLQLNDPNFSTAEEVAAAINREFGHEVALAIDSRRVDLTPASAAAPTLPAFLARVENLPVEVRRRARVVVNERTGTVVMGKPARRVELNEGASVEQLVNGLRANGTLSDSDRAVVVAQELTGIQTQLIGLANTAYQGQFLFSGTARVQPFVADNAAASGVRYNGNTGINTVTVGNGYQLQVNLPGSQLFTAAGSDMFQSIEDLITSLGSNSGIDTAVTEVRKAFDYVTAKRVFYGNVR